MKTDLFKGKGFLSKGFLNLTPVEAYKLCTDGAVMIDVRESYHSLLHTFDVPELFYCPKRELMENVDRIPSDHPVILADAAGLRSVEAVLMLQEAGFSNLANLSGGMVEWLNEKMPVKSDRKERMSGSCMCMLKHRERKSTL